MRKSSIAIVVGLMVLASKDAGAAITLYDGTQAGLPDSQGWLAFKSIQHTTTTALATGGIGPTTLNTSAGGSNAEYAGYSNYAPSGSLVNSTFPTLSPTTGFDLTFDLKLDSESHASDDRAGFSVLLLGSDLSGVELGFWDGQIFAQSASPIFTHTAEQTSGFDPTTGFYQYDLHVLGSTYTLTADGTQILTGPTRNYTANTLPFPENVPYSTPNFVFLGDDTTSAQGVTEIESVGVSVPEPTSGIPAIALAGVIRLAATRRGARSANVR